MIFSWKRTAFWSCVYKNTDLRIYSDGRVGEERTHRAPLSPKPQLEKKNRVARYHASLLTKTDYNFKIPKGKKIVNVLMLYPSYRKVILERNGEERILNSGDVFFDKIILTPFAFCKMLSESEEK